MNAGRLIRPFTGPATGVAPLPGSKSHTNRALVCAALAPGSSVLSGALFADDTRAMVDALERIGCEIETDELSRRIRVSGVGGVPPASGSDPVTLHARLSGTTSRFLLPVLANGTRVVELDGAPPLRQRPFDDQLAALRELGGRIDELGQPGRLPLRIHGRRLTGGRVRLPGAVSSQFTSGLLLSAPLHEGAVEVVVEGEVVSRPYLDLTVDVMSSFGVEVVQPNEHTFVVDAAGYETADVVIEPDASAASYFAAAAAITGGQVRIEGLDRTSRQGDVAFIDVLARMGAGVQWGAGFVEVSGGRLRGGSYDLRHFSDTAQTLAAVAVFADAPVEITGIGFIRAKETDRIGAMVTELRRCGVDVDELSDGMRIRPDVGRLHGGRIETYDDHRMAMSMTLVGLRVPGVRILDPDCVAKTFPDFFEALDELRPGAQRHAEFTVVAIDGPAGAGKSTVARLLAAELGIPHLDTGAMYRAVAAATLAAGVDLHDDDAVAELASALEIRIGTQVVVDGVDLTAEIRTPEVNQAVSIVAANSLVRRQLVQRQRDWAAALGGGVMEGRDIGTAVFPDAVLKAYLTARPEIRAQRRYDESSSQTLAQVTADIERRDRVDSSRDDSPLQAAPGAIVVDTSDLTLDQVVAELASLFRSAVEGP